jgi:superfamily II DNA/RNA helicase
MAARRPYTPVSPIHRESRPDATFAQPGHTPVSPIHRESRPRLTFAQLGVPAPLAEALAAAGIVAPFPIQYAALPDAFAGRDVLGRGRTGSGKTLAFALPVLTRLMASPAKRRPGRPRALILAPTRELAAQINATMAPLARLVSLRTATVFGGVGAGPQIAALRAGVDVLVACPGRLADHISTGNVRLDAVEITVLDEADHMADLGFLPVVKRLLDQTPAGGQRMLFSATLDAGVDVIVRRYLRNPVTHNVDSAQMSPSAMVHHVLHVRAHDRLRVLVELTSAPGRTLVFTRTKHGAKKLARHLNTSGVPAVELHGNLAQQARTRNLAAFVDGSAPTLVATDIAARGIHVDDIALVVHADPPVEHKAYLHRSGRTARAGARGTVITLMTDEQVSDVRNMTRKAGVKPVTTRLEPGDPLLASLAPGERTFTFPSPGAGGPPARGKGRVAAGAAGTARQAARRRTARAPKRSRSTGSTPSPGTSVRAPASTSSHRTAHGAPSRRRRHA